MMSYDVGVNGFKLFSFVRDGKSGIIIVYLKDDIFFTQSKYWNLSDDQIASIKEILIDNTTYNRNCSRDCEKITLPTIIWQIEQIVFN